MDRPRILRLLRIAFSAVCGIVCLLVIVLWVRSYWTHDYTSGSISRISFQLSSLDGRLLLSMFDGSPLPWSFASVSDGNGLPLAGFETFLGFGRIDTNVVSQPRMRCIIVPHWFIALATGALGCAPCLFNLPRFSLRTLLIATTLVAMLFGIVAYAVK